MSLPHISIDFDRRGTRLPAGTPGGRGGRYSLASDLIAINRQIASSVQLEVATNIQQSILRREASTNRLIRATTDRRNVISTADYLGVGVTSHLDRAAQYWRTQEEGSAAVWKHPFTGTQLYPFGKAPYPVARQRNPGIRTFGGERQPWMDGKRWVVKNEIRPMYAYRDAAADYQPGERANQRVRDSLTDLARAKLFNQPN